MNPFLLIFELLNPVSHNFLSLDPLLNFCKYDDWLMQFYIWYWAAFVDNEYRNSTGREVGLTKFKNISIDTFS